MQKICHDCRQQYDFTAEEGTLYSVMDVPMPDQCPSCRRQQRIMFRNFFHLYHRSCQLTGKKIISIYRDDAPFPVFDIHEWWSDKWDPLSYGKDIDWNTPFFEQITALHRTIPRAALVSTNCENSDYCNMAVNTKNSYLVFGCVANEDCMYGHIVWKCQDCYDCLYCYQDTRCYECIDCVQCNELAFSRDCDNCATSMFLVHCVGCRDCFGCMGLRDKQYHIFNVPCTKEEYGWKLRELNTGSHRIIGFAKEKVRQLIGKEIVKYYHGFNCESVTGDYLYNCRNTVEGYDMKNCEDIHHCATGDGLKDCRDCNFCGLPTLERCMACVFGQGYELAFCHNCSNDSARLWYCDHCFACQDCFGCAGLRNKRYCILNKQYTQKEYEEQLTRAKDLMRKTGEWGRFFPHFLSPFGYNETIAYEYFPLTKEETTARGWKWYDEPTDVENNYLGPCMDVPDDVRDVPDEITKAILRCETSGKLYKIQPQELRFYRDIKLPLPRQCFMERQRARFALRNPRKLWNRTCNKCQKPIRTTYSPERPEKVYCEECYLAQVY